MKTLRRFGLLFTCNRPENGIFQDDDVTTVCKTLQSVLNLFHLGWENKCERIRVDECLVFKQTGIQTSLFCVKMIRVDEV